MSIRKRDVHFSDWTKVRHALVCNNVQGITETSSLDEVRAFLINSESSLNPFYYYVCYIKETQEIYTHGSFYNCNGYDDSEIRDIIQNIEDDFSEQITTLQNEIEENEKVTTMALYDLNDRKADKDDLQNINLDKYVDWNSLYSETSSLQSTINSNYTTLNNKISTKANASDLNTLSAEVEENEEVTAAALTNLHETKADRSELPDISEFATTTDLNTKQDLLVSGTNIKTVNNVDITGSGNIETPDTKVTSVENHYKTDGVSAQSTTGFATNVIYDAAGHITGLTARSITESDIPSLDASKITSGTISIERLPAGALERMFIVASETAAMSATVQEGDVVQVTGNNNKMYFCVSDTATTFATKFKEFTAGTATSVAWSGVTGKPEGIDNWGNRISAIEGTYATQTWVRNNYLSLSGGSLLGCLTITAGNLIVSQGDTVVGNLYPTSDISADLGQGIRRWEDIYLGGYLSWGNSVDMTDIGDWNTLKGNYGLRIMSSTTEDSGAPYTYATALHVKGRYGFELAVQGGDVDSFAIRSITHNREWKELIHSGNIGQQSVNYATSAGAADSSKILSTTYRENINYSVNTPALKLICDTASIWESQGFPSAYCSGISAMTDYVGWQMVSYGGDAENPYFRSLQDNGTWKAWKQLAFLTDNVASATKLQTPRTIWGQSFDGTGNVDGGLYMGGATMLHTDDSDTWLNYGGANDGKSLRLCGKEVIFQYGRGDAFTRAMTITNGGNVAVGGTTGRAKLHIYGDALIESSGITTVTLKDTARNESAIAYFGNSGTQWFVGKGVGEIGEKFGFYNGTVGVVASLDINGNIKIGNTLTFANGFELYNESTSSFGINKNSSTRLVTINDSGIHAFDFVTTSDSRLKDFTKDVEIDFENLKNIPKKYYYWKDKSMGENLQIGTSAQELMKIYPTCVYYNEEDDKYSVNYQKLSIVALAAIDKLHDRVKYLESKLND